MRKVIQLILGVVCTDLLVGCGSTTQYVPLPDQSKRIEDPSKARIYVVRPTALGAAISYSISDGNRLIGNIGPNGYICWERPEGQMEVIGRAANTSSLPVEVEQGSVYYIQQSTYMDYLSVSNRLNLLSEAEGKSKVNRCKPPKVKKK